jgi:hypothetical protein
MHRRILLIFLCFLVSACGVLKKKEALDQPLPPLPDDSIQPEKAKEALSEVGGNWFYGPGLGNAALNVGAIYLFPPYAAYVLGNAMIGLAGYEEVYISDALPEPDRKQFQEVYTNIADAPGRFTAALAGKEFRTKESARERLRAKLSGN